MSAVGRNNAPCPSQFKRSSDPDCFTYVEHGSKYRSGGFRQLRVENKVVPIYSVPDKVPECLVFLLDQYIAKLPQYAFEHDVLYCRPKSHVQRILKNRGMIAVLLGRIPLLKR